jgi:hypothetical protein
MLKLVITQVEVPVVLLSLKVLTSLKLRLLQILQVTLLGLQWPNSVVKKDAALHIAVLNKLIGLKVFMDAHEPVTLEEGDRYPLGPPILSP